MRANGPADNEPFCSHCGYQLTGLVNSSKCPECGRPIVEVLVRPAQRWTGGRRYASPIVVFGLPLVHIAQGPHGGEKRGHARGIIAIGDLATGVLAIGGFAQGVIAVGGCAVGLVAFGGLALGVLAGLGGLATGLLASGGGAVGGVAQGGLAVGYVADGGRAVGHIARGGTNRGSRGGAYGTLTVGGGAGTDPATERHLAAVRWLIGPIPGVPVLMLWVVAAGVATAAITAAVVWLGYRRAPPSDEMPAP